MPAANIPTFPLERPAVRALDIIPIRQRNEELLLVRDPLGVIPGMAALVPDPLLLLVLQLGNGRTTVEDMARMATQASGQIIPVDLIKDVVKQLDEALMLLSDRFVAALEAKREAFRTSEVRDTTIFRFPPSERLRMLKEIGEEFRRHTMSPYSPPSSLDLPADSVVGVFSPHIDYQRGGEVYNWSYRALMEHGTRPSTFFILGVVHRPAAHRFIATRKTFRSLSGDTPCDVELLDEFAREFGGELFEDEYQHADEHSIELQVAYLQKMMDGKPFRIVPILVSSFDDLLEDERSPRESSPEVEAFCSALRKVLESRGDDVALVGGVDFSHCGPAFGDEEMNDEAREKAIEAGDRAMLDAVEAMNPEGFFDTFRPDFNGRKVCSVGPMYCALSALKGRANAKVLKYRQANSPDKSTLVSFASVAFTKAGVELKPKSRIILLS